MNQDEAEARLDHASAECAEWRDRRRTLCDRLNIREADVVALTAQRDELAKGAQSTPLESVDALARRFAGLDLQYRRDGIGTRRGEWRARLVVSKNERDAYRIETFGGTAQSAIAKLVDAVAEIDRR